MKKFYIVIFILCGLIACKETEPSQAKIGIVEESKQVQSHTESENKPQLWQAATVKRFKFEGGFWGIETHKGEKLLPMNLPKAFQQENLEVLIQGELVKDVMTIQQWGSPFQIKDIKLP